MTSHSTPYALGAEAAERASACQRAKSFAISAIVHASLVFVLGLLSFGASIAPSGVLLVASVERGSDDAVPEQLVVNVQVDRPQGLSETLGDAFGAGGFDIQAASGEVNVSVEPESLGGGGVSPMSATQFGADQLQEIDSTKTNRPSFFGIGVTGKRIVYIVDASGSMNEDARFLRATAELQKSLRALKPSQEYYVIFFNNDAWRMPQPGPVKASESNLAHTFRWIGGVHPDGETYPAAAVRYALDLRPDAIYLLSDGSFDSELIEYLEYLRDNRGNTSLIPIHTIALSEDAGKWMLQQIARVTRGVYRLVR